MFGGNYARISATRDGHVYAVTADGSDVRYLDSNGNGIDLGAPSPGIRIDGGSPSSVAASVGWFGSNEVFAIGSDGAIYVNSANAPGQWRLVDNSAYYAELSATVNDTVFALVDNGGGLFQETEHFQINGWFGYFYWTHQEVSPGMEWYEFSADTDASGHDEVYGIEEGNKNLYLFDQGSRTLKDYNVRDISGADGGYFYDVNWDNTAWQYNPNAASFWLYWTELGNDFTIEP